MSGEIINKVLPCGNKVVSNDGKFWISSCFDLPCAECDMENYNKCKRDFQVIE